MKTILKFVSVVGLGLFFVFGIAALMAFPTKWMINYLFTTSVLTTVFGVAKISVWQAFWLNWLCAALFKSSTSSDK